MSTPQHVFTSIALTRLRRGVATCCWIAALSLITQVLIFGVAAFMDVRHQVLEQQSTPATIVSAAQTAREQPLAVRSPLGPLPGTLKLPPGDGPF